VATELLTSVTQSQDSFQHSEKIFFLFQLFFKKTVKYILWRIYNEENYCVIY